MEVLALSNTKQECQSLDHFARHYCTRRASEYYNIIHGRLSLTPWSWVLLDKSKSSHLFEHFPTSYGTRRFITVLTRALHWSLPLARSIQSISPHSISVRSMLILAFHKRLGLPGGLFPSGFSTRNLYALFLSLRSHPCYIPCPSHPPWFYCSNYIYYTIYFILYLCLSFLNYL
jgi:hypothetical protein